MIADLAASTKMMEKNNGFSGFLDILIQIMVEKDPKELDNEWVRYDILKERMSLLPDRAINFFIDEKVLTVKYNKVQFRNRLRFMASLYNFKYYSFFFYFNILFWIDRMLKLPLI